VQILFGTRIEASVVFGLLGILRPNDLLGRLDRMIRSLDASLRGPNNVLGGAKGILAGKTVVLGGLQQVAKDPRPF
jgi:hypothetical protein